MNSQFHNGHKHRYPWLRSTVIISFLLRLCKQFPEENFCKNKKCASVWNYQDTGVLFTTETENETMLQIPSILKDAFQYLFEPNQNLKA